MLSTTATTIKGLPTECAKILANNVSDKGLISKIQKELTTQNQDNK